MRKKDKETGREREREKREEKIEKKEAVVPNPFKKTWPPLLHVGKTAWLSRNSAKLLQVSTQLD